jgi:hypothetical protein
MTDENTSLQMDLTYLPAKDRLLFTLRKGQEQADWWLTRRMVTAWVLALADKLEAVALPLVSLSQLQSAERNLGQEHALSLEFDGPKPKATASTHKQSALLLQEVSLTVTDLECSLVLKAPPQSSHLVLTRKETHALLEMLATKARQAGWVQQPQWPAWLNKAQ